MSWSEQEIAEAAWRSLGDPSGTGEGFDGLRGYHAIMVQGIKVGIFLQSELEK